MIMPNHWLHFTRAAEQIALTLLVVCGVVNGVMLGIANGQRRFKLVAGAAMAGGVPTVVGAAVAAYVHDLVPAIAGLVASQIVFSIVLAPMLKEVAANKTTQFRPNKASFLAIRSILIVALPILLASITWAGAMWWASKRLILQVNGDIEFAVYAISLQWFSAVVFIPGALNSALMPRLFSRAVEGELDSQSGWSLSFLGPISALLIAAAIAVVVIGLERVGLLSWMYGSDTRSLFPVLVPMMIAASLAATCAVLGTVAVARGGQEAWLIGAIMWAAIIIGLPNILEDQVTGVGTANSLVIAYIVWTAYGFYLRSTGSYLVRSTQREK